jgi:hypothetical protein
MNKLSRLIFCAALLTGSVSFAVTTITAENLTSAVTSMAPTLIRNTIGFKVGDTANYDLSVSSLKGTMVMKVTATDATTVTIEQLVDLKFQKQDIVEVIDKTNGKVISITVNGQPQSVPDSSGTKVVKQTQANITVPAFKDGIDCIDVVLQDAKGTQSELWIVPNKVPIQGMLKLTTTQQGMNIEADLTSFEFGM